MIAAHQAAPPATADAFVDEVVQLFGVGDEPAVEVKYAPGVCGTEHAQWFSPSPRDVVRSICRHLGRNPDEWIAVFANDGMHEHAQSWIYGRDPDEGGRRLGIVSGLSFAWLNVPRRALANCGWRPNRRVEVVG